MINEKNELVMEVMSGNEIGNGLLKGKFYDVKFANSERRKGLIVGKNKSGNYEVLTSFHENDLIKRPRKYSFDEFYVEGFNLDVLHIKNIKIIPSGDLSIDYLIKKFEEAENE